MQSQEPEVRSQEAEGYGVWGMGCEVSDIGFWVSGLGFQMELISPVPLVS
ncbi:hypothetical protein PL9214500289 [Planktothrix tepida PCC 9214]|uniref:Uncharacterized protein n=1 Tax=Planktothrix tepida PCC 9214 TaxID=671072 RepID=A0A1J1LM10_9CYAN|nr:hypothetical protein PL9214500289 [Planktothrix tepida PCC 9214]